MFSTDLAYTLEAAYREATVRQHAYFTVEHILFALLHDQEIKEALANLGADTEEIRVNLQNFFDNFIEKKIADKNNQHEATVPVQTAAVQNILQRAIIQMRAAGKDLVTAKEVLVQIFDEPDCHAAYFLKKQGLSKLDLISYITHGVSKLPTIPDKNRDLLKKEPAQKESAKRSKVLEHFTENLTAQAKAGELDPVIGRENELDRVIKILSRRQKNNPLLIGEPGVGKTALGFALAQAIVDGKVPASLKKAEVYSLEVGSLIAGTKFRGEFEERLQKIVEELASREKAILFIDEIHTIVGAGATGTGSLDAANLLKPALAGSKLRCIGSTTFEEYKKNFSKDRALTRRFSTVNINEPTIEETVKILTGLKAKFEKHHEVQYGSAALRAAAELSAKYINEKFLPDKAIDVIDEAGAANSILPAAKRKAKITEKEIEAVVSAIARVPVKAVTKSDSDNLKNLDARLMHKIFGQDDAVKAVARAIKRSRASLKDDRKPIGSFLFAGPTGVGKTELARALSEILGVPFHRLDMSEYMEKHAVSRLVGAPPGYVGYEEGGILTDLISKEPYSVLLLDEIEKAHDDIYNILLQIMDDASLTDSHGKKADFRNSIVILTTNAGSGLSNSIGFGNSQGSSKQDEAIKKSFRPEFRNRLDEIVYFNPLPAEIIEKIVDKFIIELEALLSARKVKISITPAARKYLADKGFDAQLGARPMRRIIQKEIKDRLADEILFGKLKNGGSVSIDYTDQVVIDIKN